MRLICVTLNKAMRTQTLILIGPQGSGKGTQAERLASHLSEASEQDVFRFEAGAWFRKIAEDDGYTSQRVNDTLSRGDLQPSFLAVHFWAKSFIDNLDPDTHVVVDGSPRRMLEAKIMDEALEFYQRTKPTVLHLDISEEETFNRLSSRGRNDDTDAGIRRRLEQYQKETQPVIEHYQNKDGFRYKRIDGEQSVAEVQSSLQSVIAQMS